MTMAELPHLPAAAEWQHQDCRVRFRAGQCSAQRYEISHCSGSPLGMAANLDEARSLIDERILLLRQRLAAAA